MVSRVPKNDPCRTDPIRSSGHKQLLTVGPYTVLTNLTEEDLKNPRLWGLRSPLTWAKAIALSRR